MEKQIKMGFGPIYDKNSKVLILGSFPSVKSREIDFYYGNKQNRFWKMLCDFFKEDIPKTTEGKRAFLKKYQIALWDMVMSCEIEGSADASVKNVELADIPCLLNKTKIEKILLNGTLAYDLFIQNYASVSVPFVKMPSTSPANPRYNAEIWRKELNDVFRIYE
jgi:hypoxanthine-DNA glycosylase